MKYSQVVYIKILKRLWWKHICYFGWFSYELCTKKDVLARNIHNNTNKNGKKTNNLKESSWKCAKFDKVWKEQLNNGILIFFKAGINHDRSTALWDGFTKKGF